MTKGTVLVVEDDHDTRVALRQCLEQAGYSIVSTTNGARALELLGEMTTPLAILLDLNMPIMNGDELLKILQASPTYRAIPVIQMSAANNPRRVGVHDALAKPLDLERLLRVLSSCHIAKEATAGS